MKFWDCFLFFTIIIGMTRAMSRPQLKKTMTIMKNQCVSKIGVPESKVSKIEQGQFIEDRDVMCYIACIYKSTNVVKNDKLQYDLISKQVDVLYPPDLKDAVKKGAAKCMPLQDNYSDGCEGIFFATKCLYEFDPASFVFP